MIWEKLKDFCLQKVQFFHWIKICKELEKNSGLVEDTKLIRSWWVSVCHTLLINSFVFF